MRITPVPDKEVPDGWNRITLSPPPGMDPWSGTIVPCEVLQASTMVEGNVVPVFFARYILEDGDLQKLEKGQPFWLMMLGHCTPFDIEMELPPTIYNEENNDSTN